MLTGTDITKAFTRTLTVIYSATLLSLLTTLQLNIVGRFKYLQATAQLLKEEKLRELQSLDSPFSLSFRAPLDTEEELEQWLNEDIQVLDVITEETERKFLTLSWWLLYVGWKDVGERVRKSVEEVFEG